MLARYHHLSCICSQYIDLKPTMLHVNMQDLCDIIPLHL